MKYFGLYLLVALFTCSVGAQSASAMLAVDVGDTFVIGTSEDGTYKHIKFPKENFIIKRGGIASFKQMPGTVVEVVSLSKDTSGKTLIKIKRSDSGRFFGSHPTVTAQLEAAISSGELVAQ